MLASTTLGLVLLIESRITNVAVITAIASSAFVVFTRPGARMTIVRRVLGGHIVGVLVGLLAVVLLQLGQQGTGTLTGTTGSIAAVAVGVSMLAMAITDTEHPPAAGTVLGLIIGADPLRSAALVMGAAIFLCSVRSLLRRWLTDLAADE
jgi:hypothetical protein